ncbi:DUF4333 domain-containing protein [Mycobacterium sp. SMC-8]|uniref:DUF4333 domain-containing protein n=1 Tax=Mycobacterium sp. SMC-8 TaxID=2857060 RepID=UPI0021B2FA9D|nr:DUF4333 domain-containing protein [Mycobacterium sp. SMC-8]UXA11296.1 DUF4333 domain-containing protein [Mycobacterium sp. SMC-8]
MSGPQGSDPTQPWPGQQPEQGTDQPAGESAANQGWQPPTPGAGQQPEQQGWQPPAYTPQQYPQYQQPTQPPTYTPAQYPADQYGQQPAEYNPAGYPPPGQYSQPGGYGQQYGQPNAYGQPGPYGQYPGAPGYPAPGQEEGSKRSLAVIGGVVGVLAAVVIAAVLVLGFWKPGFFVTTKLDINAAQAGVEQILTDETNGYGARNVNDVKCNNGVSPTVKKGDSFNCEVSIDGTKRQVTVTFQDDDGTYEVGRPK